MDGNFWIGGSDIDTGRSFVWTDGSPFNYTNYEPGQPNDSGVGGQDCIISGIDGWHDLGCHIVYPFLCRLSYT